MDLAGPPIGMKVTFLAPTDSERVICDFRRSDMKMLRQLIAHGSIAELPCGGFPIEDATGLPPRGELDRFVFQVHGCGSTRGAC